MHGRSKALLRSIKTPLYIVCFLLLLMFSPPVPWLPLKWDLLDLKPYWWWFSNLYFCTNWSSLTKKTESSEHINIERRWHKSLCSLMILNQFLCFIRGIRIEKCMRNKRTRCVFVSYSQQKCSVNTGWSDVRWVCVSYWTIIQKEECDTWFLASPGADFWAWDETLLLWSHYSLRGREAKREAVRLVLTRSEQSELKKKAVDDGKWSGDPCCSWTLGRWRRCRSVGNVIGAATRGRK